MSTFIDGFDHYNYADMLNKWSGNTNTGQFAMATGRFTGQSFKTHNQANAEVFRDMGTSFATWQFGCAFFTPMWPNANASIFKFSFGPTEQFSVKMTTNGDLVFTNNGSVITATSTGSPLVPNRWNYIEIFGSMSTSVAANAVQIYLNGALYLTMATGQNTQQGTTSGAMSRISLCGDAHFVVPYGNNFDTFFDDLYFDDATGSSSNVPHGDSRIETLYPVANGATNQWTPSSGANYACVAEAQADGDSTYVSDATVGDIDLYSIGALSSTPLTVFTVAVNLWARKDDTAARTIAPVVRLGGTNYAGSADPTFSGYLDTIELLDASPATGVAWLPSEIASLQVGVKVTA